MSKTTLPGNSEFTIHVNGEYDYRFVSERYKISKVNIFRKDEIIEVLKHRFAEKMNANLPIFGIDKSNLKDFTTTEKDLKRG